MSSTLLVGFLAASFTAYPAFGDKGLSSRRVEINPRVEATIDKGPIVEMIVRCQRGTAIISYSKLERLYCGPTHGCERDAAPVVRRACGG